MIRASAAHLVERAPGIIEARDLARDGEGRGDAVPVVRRVAQLERGQEVGARSRDGDQLRRGLRTNQQNSVHRSYSVRRADVRWPGRQGGWGRLNLDDDCRDFSPGTILQVKRLITEEKRGFGRVRDSRVRLAARYRDTSR